MYITESKFGTGGKKEKEKAPHVIDTRRFSNHESCLISRSHTYAIIVILDLKIHQSRWIHWPFFPKTWTKGHWPLDDLWPHVCWGHMCDSTQGSLCPSPMTIHQCMWIQWSILQNTTYILHTTCILHTYYVHTTYRMSDHIVSYWTQFRRDKKKRPLTLLIQEAKQSLKLPSLFQALAWLHHMCLPLTFGLPVVCTVSTVSSVRMGFTWCGKLICVIHLTQWSSFQSWNIHHETAPHCGIPSQVTAQWWRRRVSLKNKWWWTVLSSQKFTFKNKKQTTIDLYIKHHWFLLSNRLILWKLYCCCFCGWLISQKWKTLIHQVTAPLLLMWCNLGKPVRR